MSRSASKNIIISVRAHDHAPSGNDGAGRFCCNADVEYSPHRQDLSAQVVERSVAVLGLGGVVLHAADDPMGDRDPGGCSESFQFCKFLFVIKQLYFFYITTNISF